MENTVSKELCTEKHKAVDENLKRVETRINKHSEQIDLLTELQIKLASMVELIRKKDIFDKILIISVFLVCLMLAAIILGPEILGRIIGG